MEVLVTLSDQINKINYGDYITKPSKDFIIEVQNKISFNNIKITELKKFIQNFVKSKKLSKKLKSTIINIIDEIKKEINNIDQINIKNFDKDNILEKELDSECHRYNKYTNNNPAEYISYDRNKDRYILKFDKVIYKKKNLTELVLIQKKMFKNS
jgi:hypothetical protein